MNVLEDLDLVSTPVDVESIFVPHEGVVSSGFWYRVGHGWTDIALIHIHVVCLWLLSYFIPLLLGHLILK